MPEIVEKNPCTLSLHAPDKRTILVQAFDKTENYTTTSEKFIIKAIEAPVITDYPRELLPGSFISVKGTAIPEATIIVSIQKDKEEVKRGETTKSDKEGK